MLLVCYVGLRTRDYIEQLPWEALGESFLEDGVRAVVGLVLDVVQWRVFQEHEVVTHFDVVSYIHFPASVHADSKLLTIYCPPVLQNDKEHGKLLDSPIPVEWQTTQ